MYEYRFSTETSVFRDDVELVETAVQVDEVGRRGQQDWYLLPVLLTVEQFNEMSEWFDTFQSEEMLDAHQLLEAFSRSKK